MEQFNPDYDRKLKQRTKEVWGPKFVKGDLPASAICITAKFEKSFWAQTLHYVLHSVFESNLMQSQVRPFLVNAEALPPRWAQAQMCCPHASSSYLSAEYICGLSAALERSMAMPHVCV